MNAILLISFLLLQSVFGNGDGNGPVLQNPFDLPPPVLFFCETSEFLFRFDLSTAIRNENIQLKLARGDDCDIDIDWGNNYLIPHVEYDLAPPFGDGGISVRQVALVLQPNLSLIGNSPIYTISEDGKTGSLDFCATLEIYTDDMTTLINYRSVQYKQTTSLQGGLRKLGTTFVDDFKHRRLNIDCVGEGYDSVFENWWQEGSGVPINPSNITYEEEDGNDEEGQFSGVMVGPAQTGGVGSWGTFAANLTYDSSIVGQICDENNAPIVVPVYNQGDTIRVCIKIDEDAESNGLFIKSIDSFSFSKTGVDLIQHAIEGGQSDFYGLSEFECSPGSSQCWVSSILRAEFFSSPGLVTISGIGSLQFGSSAGRSLHFEEEDQRELQNQGRQERGKFTLQFPVTTFQETFQLKRSNLQAMSQTQAILLVFLTFILIMNCTLLCWIKQSRRIHSLTQTERLLKSKKLQRQGAGSETCTKENKE